MRCPECDSTANWCRETKRATVVTPEDALRRRRVCRDCGHEWSTTERQDRWDPHRREWVGHQPAELPPLPPPKPAKQRRASATFHPVDMDAAADLLVGIPPDVATVFLDWWNGSRRSKHGTKAAWTRAAFKMSADRVKKLVHWQQVLLTNAGVEFGWQALNPTYLRDELAKGEPRHGAGFKPQSSGLAGALAIIEGGSRGG